MQHQLQAIVTIVSLVNPGICGAMFALGESRRSGRAQAGDAAKVALTVLAILTAAALGGIKLLHLCGVSLDAFSVAGGGVLAWMGFSMLRGESMTSAVTADTAKTAAAEATATDAEAEAAAKTAEPSDIAAAAPSLTPLILFAASPGTITGVITLSIAHTGAELPVTALVAVAVATLILWLTLLLFSRLGNVASDGGGSGGSFVRDTVTRFTGLIVIAMGVQFALTGIRSFMLGGGQ